MKPSIYIAAPYPKKDEARDCKVELEGLGYKVVSTWTEEPEKASVTLVECEDERLLQYAQRDVMEVTSADVLVLLTVDLKDEPVRAGRHVEFGIALGQGLATVVVGPKINIFHYLPTVWQYDSWTEFLQELINGEFEI